MFFADFNAKELSALAADLKIAGRSKMKKQELYDACAEVINAAHTDALAQNSRQGSVECALMPIPCPEGVSEQLSAYAMPVVALQGEKYPLSAYLTEGQKRLPRKVKKELRKRGWL